MKDYKSFRVGNPVCIQAGIRYIRSLPDNKQGAIQGYSFLADGNVKQYIEPYPIDEDFLRVYSHLKRSNGGDTYYLFQKELDIPYQTSSNHGCVLKYYPSKNKCEILKIDWEQPLVFSVSALHELFNLIEDYCGYRLPKYYPSHVLEQ